MFIKNYHLPAKGMLFGEYGVLENYPAVAVTFYTSYFSINIYKESISHHKYSQIYIKSSFFSNGSITFNFENTYDDKEYDFFYNLILPWKKKLFGFNLYIEILNSFSPNLGFGSSSAIIASISLYLYENFYGNRNYIQEDCFWEKVRESIFLIQGAGSGYDVSVQISSFLSEKKNPQIWHFQNQLHNTVPLLKKLNIPLPILKKYGCFIKTYIYSDTKKALQDYLDPINNESLSSSENKNNFPEKNKHKIYYGKKHGEIASLFLNDFSLNNLAFLMKKSFEINLEQNLIPQDNLAKNLILKLKDIPFKTMGAGLGDCLWVLANKNKLINDLNFSSEDIAFAFEDIEG